jgi:cardiolipin synthase
MNIPNALTVLRIILVPVIIICLIQREHLSALLLFIIAGVTDGLDGFFARILKQKSVLGSYLDPLADKTLISSSFITLAVMGGIPAWLTVIVISRDFIILIGISVLALLSIPFEVRPTMVSKMTTAFQLLAIFLVLLLSTFSFQIDSKWIAGVFWLTALLTIVSGMVYLIRGIRYINSESIRA